MKRKNKAVPKTAGASLFVLLAFFLSAPVDCTQKREGTGYERQVKTDEKVSNHVLCGSGDQPAGGSVALFRAVDVWLGLIYTV